MKYIAKNTLAIITILLLLISNSIPAWASLDTQESNIDVQKELYLMRGEHYLYLNASDNVNEFHLRFVFPPDYQYQAPTLLEIYNDTTADILHYQIEDDLNKPNKIINFTIGPMHKNESVLLHFSCWVLVKNHEFEDLSNYVKFPKKRDLPEETKTWLTSTKVVQVHSILIRHKARQLRGCSNNLIQFANRVASFIKNHRFLLFLIQLKLRILFSQDALTTLLINGENVGRSHLACAFFRGYNVPARVLLAHNDQGFWTQMHYMVEYYCPGYGWVLIDSTKGKTPYATKRQIINRISFPEDEENTKRDYIIPTMKGEERWMWIDNENIYPYYLDCKTGSKSQMFYEGNIETNAFTADYAFLLTHMVYHQYEKYLGVNLTGENLGHLQNATTFHLKAIAEFQQSNIQTYIDNMYLAYYEYLKIIL
ncbi:MAG: transglutaminase domain-containing protein [Thermoplasmatales archaeon]|nr:MAG: transglutaminase domain-containing protein [Thermoplasmatales archaeon]